jgi:hypothetical protein
MPYAYKQHIQQSQQHNLHIIHTESTGLYRARPGTGSTDNVLVWARSQPGSNDSNQILHRTFWVSWAILFSQRKSNLFCAHPMLVLLLGSRNKSHQHDFLEVFYSYPLPEKV